MQPFKTRLHGPINHPISQPHYGLSAQGEPRTFDETLNQTAPGEHIPSRGRLPGIVNGSGMPINQSAVQAMSARSQSSAATVRSPTAPNVELERRPSMTQTFHYTNKSHGGYSHVRNASFVNSPATSPLSPHITSADHAIMPMTHHGTPDLRPKESPLTLTNGSMALEAGSAIDRENGDASHSGLTQKRVERTNSGRPRRAHSHKRTHSRQHQQDQKTVGEYALHHLFTSVCLHLSSFRP